MNPSSARRNAVLVNRSAESAHVFESHRAKLFGLAYRMLGVRAEAEDVLQDAYLRWTDADRSEVRSSEAWLTTSVTRLAIDRLRKLKTEREAYFGPWLPEPLAEQDLATPELAAELQDDVSIAFLTMLEALAPEERAAFVLHDVLDDDYVDIAEALGKTEAACRQLVHRARERVTAKRRRFQVDDTTRRRMLEKFIAIAAQGDRKQIVQLFSADATMTSDGGGKVLAVFRPLLGAVRISYLWHALARRMRSGLAGRIVQVNGELGFAFFWQGKLVSVSAIETDGEVIHSIYTIRNPDKLSAYAGSMQLLDRGP
jgi:RNA polymerase sigma-70 factor, ECF subfamily